MTRFAGKVALITGAASGVGRATALRLSAEGASVHGVDIDGEGLEETAATIREAGGTVEVGLHDLSRTADCRLAAEGAVAAFGRLDILANVAGVNRFHRFSELTEEEWDLTFDVNLKGMAFLCQAALPSLLETKGSIVNVASVAGLMGQAYFAAYCASKGGVIQLTRCLAMEYVKQDIRVNAVAPGTIETPMTTNIRFPPDLDWSLVKPYMGRRGACQADEVAAAIAYLASDEARFVHGAILSIDGGLAAGG